MVVRGDKGKGGSVVGPELAEKWPAAIEPAENDLASSICGFLCMSIDASADVVGRGHWRWIGGREIGGWRAVESLPHALETAIPPLPHTHLACWCLLPLVWLERAVPPQQIRVQATEFWLEAGQDVVRQSGYHICT